MTKALQQQNSNSNGNVIYHPLVGGLLNNIPHMALLCNSDGIIVACNNKTREELKDWEDKKVSYYMQEPFLYIHQVTNHLNTLKTKTSSMPVLIDAQPIPHNCETFHLITIKPRADITESWNFIDNLALVLDNAKDLACIKDLDLRIISANKAFIKAAGLNGLNEVQGKTDAEIFGTNDRVLAYMEDERLAQTLKPGEFIEKEEDFEFHTGKVIRTMVRKFPIYDENDNLLATANISRDITYLKQIQETLAQTKEKYKDLIEHQGEGIGILDQKLTFLFTNPAAEHIFESEKGQLHGKRLTSFLDREELSAQKHEGLLQAINKTKSVELKITTKSGKQKYLLVTLSPYHYEKNISGSFAIFHDMTERKMAREKLLESERMLKELNATKDKFFSIIAHDLKNPFGSIMGFTQLMLSRIDVLEKQKIIDYLNLVHKASEHGFSLLENLLEWSRTQQGVLNSRPAGINVLEQIKYNAGLLAELASQKDIEIGLQASPDLYMFADEDMINTVLRNLITNAIKFSPRKGKIEILASQVNKNW
ncbi:MAG: PAS domain S-box protein [Bacteroidales bacterium]|nr:PAS domain S-box protein [Bacteroidales bacterium]